MKRALLLAIPVAVSVIAGIGIAMNNGTKMSTPTADTPKLLSSPTQVAKETCGDPSDNSITNWYPVFIDGGNLAEIQAKFCRDAIAKTREKTGQPTVQVASFSDRGRAEEFAKSVGGEVGQSYSVKSSDKAGEKPVEDFASLPETRKSPVNDDQRNSLAQMGLSQEEQKIANQIPLDHPCLVMTEIYDDGDKLTGKIKNICNYKIPFVAWDVKFFTNDPQNILKKDSVVLSNIDSGEKQPFTIHVLEPGLKFNLQNLSMRWSVSSSS